MFGVCIKTFDDPNLTFQEYLDSRIIEIDIDQLTRILWLCGKPDDEFLSKISSEEVSRQAIFYSVFFLFFFFFFIFTPSAIHDGNFLFNVNAP